MQQAGPIDREHVYYDSPGDGWLWARGASYKAGFGTQGTIYAPFLGSSAPRDFPVTFRIANISLADQPIAFDVSAVAEQAGDVVRYQRGGVVEMYTLAPHAIEQSFVFQQLPVTSTNGDLVLRLSSETELPGRETDAGLVFENELGAIHYGRATAFDARGVSIKAVEKLTDQGIEIRVPASFVAAARLPLIIDPMVSTAFAIATSTADDESPDVAYDLSTDRWLAVYEETFSATDHDVLYHLMDSNGLTLSSGYIDESLSEYWANPACANNNSADQFLVVAQVGSPTSGTRKIEAREILAGSSTVGPAFDIAPEDPFVDKINPDVGGDPQPFAPTYYLVVWEKVFSPTDHDIYSRMVHTGNGVSGSIQVVDISGSFDTKPSISKSNDGSDWNIAWERDLSATQTQIRCARVHYDGVTTASSFEIGNTIPGTFPVNPSASTCLHGTSTWAVAYEYTTNTQPQPDVLVTLVDGGTTMDTLNLSATEREFSGPLIGTFYHPDIDSDGQSFAVATGLDAAYDYIGLSTVSVIHFRLYLSEGPLFLNASPTLNDYPSIASTEGSAGTARRQMIVFVSGSVSAPSGGDIFGAIYDDGLYTGFCFPDDVHYPDVYGCPCGNPPSQLGRGCNNSANTGGANLYANATPSLSSDSMELVSHFEPTHALTVFNQGNALASLSVAFGQGVRCVGGSLKRLYVKTASGGTSTAPGIGDLSISARSAVLGDPIAPGTKRYYYAYYRDPNVLGGCASGATFNSTQSLQALWIP